MVRGVLIAVGITIGLLLPPIIHFISGPIGPFVGGYVSVASWKNQPRTALAAGLIFGLAVFLIFAIVVAVVLVILGSATDVISGGTGALIIGLSIGATINIGTLSTVGATVGATRGRGSVAAE